MLAWSSVAAIVAAVVVGWWSSGDDDTYLLDPTVASIALNEGSQGRMLAVVDVEDASGRPVSTGSLIGGPLVVNFWFTTCEPCRREFPVLVETARERPDLRFVGVNLNDTSEAALSFAGSYGATFEMLFDRDGRLTTAMGVATAPVTLLVDPGGLVVRQLTGEVTKTMLDDAIGEAFPS